MAFIEGNTALSHLVHERGIAGRGGRGPWREPVYKKPIMASQSAGLGVGRSTVPHANTRLDPTAVAHLYITRCQAGLHRHNVKTLSLESTLETVAADFCSFSVGIEVHACSEPGWGGELRDNCQKRQAAVTCACTAFLIL